MTRIQAPEKAPALLAAATLDYPDLVPKTDADELRVLSAAHGFGEELMDDRDDATDDEELRNVFRDLGVT